MRCEDKPLELSGNRAKNAVFPSAFYVDNVTEVQLDPNKTLLMTKSWAVFPGGLSGKQG